jgi:hypothetical protein
MPMFPSAFLVLCCGASFRTVLRAVVVPDDLPGGFIGLRPKDFHLFSIAAKRWSQKGLGAGKPIDLLAGHDSISYNLAG